MASSAEATTPEAQGFERVADIDGGELDRLVGVEVYGCPECGATYNAGDAHLATCSRRPGDAA